MPTVPAKRTDQPESEVLKECLAFLRERGCLADRQNNGSFCTAGQWHTYGIVGSGDIIGIGPGGVHIEIETKAGRGGRLSTLQQRRQDRVTRHGGKYAVVHSVDELAKWYEREVMQTTEGVFDGCEDT